MKNKLYRITIFTFFPLLTGGLIYTCFRLDNLLMFDWFRYFGLTSIIDPIRQSTLSINIPNWIKYSLPDALWIFSLINFILILWDNKYSRQSIFWIILASSIGIISELGQGIHLVPGTFDLIDLLLLTIASTLPFIKIQTFIKNLINYEK